MRLKNYEVVVHPSKAKAKDEVGQMFIRALTRKEAEAILRGDPVLGKLRISRVALIP